MSNRVYFSIFHARFLPRKLSLYTKYHLSTTLLASDGFYVALIELISSFIYNTIFNAFEIVITLIPGNSNQELNAIRWCSSVDGFVFVNQSTSIEVVFVGRKTNHQQSALESYESQLNTECRAE